MADRSTDNGSGSSERSEHLLGAGAEIAGAVAGTGLGLLFGPAGALAGAAAGPVVTRGLRRAIGDVAARRLSHRETVRAGAAAAYAAVEVASLLEEGRAVRTDGFFGDALHGRSVAEEIAEAVLLAAQRDPQEAKAPLLGKMLGRIAFEPRIDQTYAHLLVKLAERLTYRQLCLLALYNLKVRAKFDLRDGMPLNRGDIDSLDQAVGLFEEIRQLHQLTMLQQRSREHPGTDIILTVTTINPARQELVGIGGWIYELMDLSNSVPPSDLAALAKDLNGAFRE